MDSKVCFRKLAQAAGLRRGPEAAGGQLQVAAAARAPRQILHRLPSEHPVHAGGTALHLVPPPPRGYAPWCMLHCAAPAQRAPTRRQPVNACRQRPCSPCELGRGRRQRSPIRQPSHHSALDVRTRAFCGPRRSRRFQKSRRPGVSGAHRGTHVHWLIGSFTACLDQEEKTYSEEQSSLVSGVYTTLRDPLNRAIYLVRGCCSSMVRVRAFSTQPQHRSGAPPTCCVPFAPRTTTGTQGVEQSPKP